MDNTGRLVKIYDAEHNFLGSGHLLSMGGRMIKVKGSSLPILASKTEIIVEIYNEFSGINPFFCKVRLASKNQLNALILKTEQVIERRSSLKVRSDLSFYINSFLRDDEDITKDVPGMKVDILNLSIGGMLISSNYNLMVNDILTFYFQYEKSRVILLMAKVIRIDKTYDVNTKVLSMVSYGCKFEKVSPYDEAIISMYLYDRQRQIYKDK